MNCQDFESIVLDLVRGEAGSSAEAAGGQAHAAICARCAALLSEQQNLTVGLEALAQTEEERAPERVEGALRLKFRNRNARAARLPSHERRGPAQTWISEIFRSRLAWAMTVTVVVAGISIVIAQRLRVKPDATPLAHGQSAPPVMPITPHPGRAAIRSSALSRSRQTRTAAMNVERFGNRQARRRFAAPNERSRRAPTPSENANDEAVTPFYPLPYGSGLGLDEGWELVRVNMPLSALASLGIPVADEQSSAQLVKADVVLGQDGMARAIRFVK